MILSARLWSLILFLKYSSFCGSLKPRTLSLDGHTQRDEISCCWSGGDPDESRGSRFPTWGSSAARPLTLIHLHHLTSHYSENPETDDTRPDHQRWTTRYIHHWIFPFLLFQGKRHEEDLKDWVFFLHQIELSERKWKYELDVLILFPFSPVQDELLHRDCFSNASDSLCQHSSDGFVLSR